MDSKNLGGILDKINELRALFIFGQRVIPFLEELFYFVHDIVPVLEEINRSLYESANKMPRASSQLNKVTKATELATTEILDNLDGVLAKLNTIDEGFEKVTKDLDVLSKLDRESIKILRTEWKGDGKEVLQSVSNLGQQKQVCLKGVLSNVKGLEKSLKDIRTRSNDIMMSLQVQDITAQQIASVNHLIESVQERLSELIDKFSFSGTELIKEIKKGESYHFFDPDADYDKSGSRQKAADEFIKEASSLMNGTNNLNEKLFSHATRNANQSFVKNSPASQDEIDKLFVNGAMGKPKRNSRK
jgi:chemotaxis regulatin CheY-phosphate phosphatase CheZ